MHTHVSDLTRIIFSNGVLDPWHVGGVLPGRVPLHKDARALLFNDSAHHLDLRAPSPQDPVSIVQGRAEETRLIGNWLRQIYRNK